MIDQITNVMAISLIALLAAREWWIMYHRSADDVLQSLGADREEQLVKQEDIDSFDRLSNEDILLGFRSTKERLHFHSLRRILPLALILTFLLTKNLFISTSAHSTVMALCLGLSISYLLYRRVLATRRSKYIRRIEFYLPLVMERLVMGAQSGLDIIASIGTITDIEGRKEESHGSSKMDPVSFLLSRVYQLAESGVPFERALERVASPIPCAALKHAFIHLSTAHTNGGELVMPLRELSDSTQTFYQESREEEIAKLPVRATAPLMCIFAGLMIVFITSPILQIITMTSKAIPK